MTTSDDLCSVLRMDISEVRDKVETALKTSEGFSNVEAIPDEDRTQIGFELDGELYFLVIEST